MTAKITTIYKKNSIKLASFYLSFFLLHLSSFAATNFKSQNNKLSPHQLYRPVPINRQLIQQVKRGGGTLISERAGGYIERASSLTENKKYDKAIELLEYHYNRVDQMSPLERASFAVHIAATYRQKPASTENKKKSLEYFQKALDFSALDYNSHLDALYQIAQIHIEDNETEKGFEVLKKWFSINENPQPQAYILLAGIYFAKMDLEESLKYVEQTLRLVPKPKENWLQFAAAIHLKRKSYKKARPYLERLTALFPDKAGHWKQLAGVYLLLNDNKKAFVTLDIAYKMGHLKRKTELLNLASLYVDQELPYQAGLLLEKSMEKDFITKEQKNLEFIAESFYLAREGGKSLKYLKQASQTAKDSKFFLKYGQRLLNEEQYQEAEAVFRKVLAKQDIQQSLQSIKIYKRSLVATKEDLAMMDSKITQAGLTDQKARQKQAGLILENSDGKILSPPPTNQLEKVYLYLGIALYNQKKPEKALNYFKKSIEIDDTFLNAYQWIDFAEARLLEIKQARL